MTSSTKSFYPFAVVAIAWLGVGTLICADQPQALMWMAVFWGLCVLDLFTIAMLVSAITALAAGRSEKQGALIIQASTWGIIKLACLGIFAAILLQGFTIPSKALFTGMGTLMIVPLVGGLWWSQRELRHAC